MLEINWVAVLTQSVTFVVLVWFLGKFALGPVGNPDGARRNPGSKPAPDYAPLRGAASGLPSPARNFCCINNNLAYLITA